MFYSSSEDLFSVGEQDIKQRNSQALKLKPEAKLDWGSGRGLIFITAAKVPPRFFDVGGTE